MDNLVNLIRKNLGYGELKKVDPNTQDVTENEKTFGSSSLAQAAIPAVLLGIYNHLQTREGTRVILEEKDDNTIKWLNVIFGPRENELVSRIAAYAGTSEHDAKHETGHIASEAVRVIREQIPDKDKTDFNVVTDFVAKNKIDTLRYLPASLKLGSLLDNENIDDRTNKMEGPVSNLMHSIEKQFNSPKNT